MEGLALPKLLDEAKGAENERRHEARVQDLPTYILYIYIYICIYIYMYSAFHNNNRGLKSHFQTRGAEITCQRGWPRGSDL